MPVALPEGYAMIRAETLAVDRPLPMDVFVLVDGRPVRYGAKNVGMDAERFRRLQTLRDAKLLIRTEDEAVYREALEQRWAEAQTRSDMPLAERTSVFSGGVEAAASDVMSDHANEAAYSAAQARFEGFGNFLKGFDGSVASVVKLASSKSAEGVGHDSADHGTRVAALSLALAELQGKIRNSADRTALVTGCFLHDLAIEASGLPFVDESAYTPEQLLLWKRHPMDAAAMFADKPYVDARVLRIIVEHHEIPNGSGFPKGLLGKAMDPLAIIVSLVNRFDLYYRKANHDGAAALKEFSIAEIGRYDLADIEALRKAVMQVEKTNKP